MSSNKKSILRLFFAFAASAVMLSLAQAPIGFWPLAWVGYVPFVLACSPSEKPSRLCLAAYAASACFWLGNIYWLGFVTTIGWIAFCLYMGLLWPVLALSIRWCRQKKVPLVIAVPILVVGIEQSQGIFLGGFYWHYLAYSQYANNAIIQIADIFGAAGVSFLVAIVNGLVADMFLVRNSLFPLRGLRIVLRLLLVSAAIFGAIGYGQWRIGQSDKYITKGPLVAAVQTNVPQSVKQTFAAEDQIFDELVKNNKQCVAAGAKLVVWPETMVQGILDQQVLRLLEEKHSYKIFDNAIREQAKGGAYILLGAYGGNPRIEENFDIRLAQKYNSAFLYTPDGNQAPEKYSKIHLVPFGEVVPFASIPVIHNLMIKFSPYDFDYTLDAGKEYTVFEMNNAGRFGVVICYEDAVPALARRFALDKEGKKRIDWLVNISNDGWFVRFHNDKVITSTELAQHSIVCSLRAVENRLAVVRSVNTGISCLIDTLGRIKDGYAAGNLPKRAFDRKGVEGWFADFVPVDARTTFFSKYGQWLDLSCQICLALIIMAQLVEGFVFKRETRKTGTTEKVAK